jgi:WhiB family redox-sensing transcriptional regulator
VTVDLHFDDGIVALTRREYQRNRRRFYRQRQRAADLAAGVVRRRLAHERDLVGIFAAWRDVAACKSNGKLFFGPARESAAARAVREAQAKTVCHACPSLEPCRAAGRENREHGVWGAETELERTAAGYGPTNAGSGELSRVKAEYRRSQQGDPRP